MINKDNMLGRLERVKKVAFQESLTPGLSWVIYEDGTEGYRSVEYSFKYPEFVKNELLGRIQRKSGITGRYETHGEFLKSKKRDNPGIEFVMWDFDAIPSHWDRESAKQYQNLKDRLFVESMEIYRASKDDNRLGDEVYECDNTVDLDRIITDNWAAARLEAHKIISKEVDFNHSLPGMSYRKGQEEQTIALYEAIKEFGFTEGELPPGLGKTALFYFLGKLLKGRVNLYVTDTVKNATELTWKMYDYNLMDKKVLPNPIVIDSEESNHPKIMKSGAQVLPAQNGDNPALIRLLNEAANNNEEYNLFTTYYSVGELLKVISKIDGFPKMNLFRDECHVTSEKTLDHTFNAPLQYKHLFSQGVGLTGSAIRRPEGSTDRSVVYNGDDFHWGNLDLVVTESEARAMGLIADQKLLMLPVPEGNEDLRRAIRNRSKVRLTLGTSMITGRTVTIDTRASMLLVKRGLEEATKIGKHHIHIPTTQQAITKKTVRAIKLMQECGIIPSKYKVFQALRNDGDKILEEWNNEEFAIVVGTRWMNRGTDTVKCDCQIYTYVPTSEAIAIQLKGRGHRTHDSKDYFLMVLCEFEDNINSNPLYIIAERELKGKGYAVVGNDPIAEELDVEGSIEDLGSRVDPTVDALDNNDVVVAQGEGSDPDLFLSYVDLVEHIVTDTYTDEYGNDLFERMAHAKGLDYDKVAKAALDCEGRFEFQQRYRSEYNWAQTRGLLDEVCKHMESQRVSKWSYDLLVERGILEGYKTISDFIRANASKWNTLSEEDQKKVREYYPDAKKKAVECYTEDGIFITIYESAKAAAIAIGKPRGNSEINTAAQNKRTHSKGADWAYDFRWKRV